MKGAVAWSLLLAIFALCESSLPTPEYSYNDHPLYKTPQLRSPPSPVVMKKYFRFKKGAKHTSNMLFAPGSATYQDYNTKEHFFSNLDSLLIPGTGRKSSQEEGYVEVHLNHDARVFVLLNGRGIGWKLLRNLSSVSVTGLDDFLPAVRAVRLPTKTKVPIGDSQRSRRPFYLPWGGVLVETFVPKDTRFVLPHPSLVTVGNGNPQQTYPVSRYTLFFARPDSKLGEPIRFDYPSVPDTLQDPVAKEDVQIEPATPNGKCPDWLHDLYQASSRDESVAKKEGESLMWRTWHAIIDPVYWCYFDHEHGSFPGKYEPLFDYTAWKTPDNSTSHGRQNESHEGFKVFSFALHDQGKYIVITVHMHVSKARRFTARHHTVAFAVLDKDNKLEMELHMKMDFGPAQVTRVTEGNKRKTVAANPTQQGIADALRSKGIRSGRRFNVLNIDENYPDSVDQSFALNCRLTPTASNKHRILRGVYEQWKGPLNSCTSSSNRFNRGFKFDVRDPSTAMRRVDAISDDSMQYLRGGAVNRIMVIPGTGLEVGTEHCDFDIFRSDDSVHLKENEGVFYTDPYFREVHEGSGLNSLRQFVKPGFQTIKIKKGKISPLDPWIGFMDYETKEQKMLNRRLANIEGAVRKERN